MIRSLFSLMLVTSIVLCFQCEKSTPDPIITPPIEFSCQDDPQVCELATANGNFAIDLFKNVIQEEQSGSNIFISPFSISTALHMTLNGAAGQTLQDMHTTLRTNDLDVTQLNTAFQKLLDVLPQLDRGTQLQLANSIWPQVGYPVLSSFLETNESKYNSEVVPVNFADAPAVIQQVNNWVSDHTNGLIEETLTELPSNVVMLLINAIYFKASWQKAFDPAETRLATFYSPQGELEAPMMHQAEVEHPYFETEYMQAVDLSYGDSIFSMSVFLPKSDYTVDDIIANLNATRWNDWLASFQTQQIELFLPKFKLEYEIKLKKNLSIMGMANAFSGAADFSQMIDGGGVKIDDVIHKSFVEVNEEGTEAAAVTVVVIVETSVPLHPIVNANRPFLFVIRDKATNSILFMGRLNDPTS